MTFYIRRGSQYNIVDEADLQVEPILPNGTYTINFNPLSGQFFFEVVDSFTPLGKVYGDTPHRAERVLQTFEDRPAGTGVLLTGEKGSGKTMLAKILSMQGLDRGYVTILVNQPWHGEQFNGFIQQIEQPAIILFDEFEKVYSREQQTAILTLLDGTYSSKKLFVMTCNDRYRIDEHMMNRPGRFFYLFEYKGLDPQFVAEYCQDNLLDVSKIDDVIKYSSTFYAFNFDMLKAIVEEMNRYGEGVKDVIKFLNVSSNDSAFVYDVVRYIPDLDSPAEDPDYDPEDDGEGVGSKKVNYVIHSGSANNGETHTIMADCWIYVYRYRERDDATFVRDLQVVPLTQRNVEGRVQVSQDRQTFTFADIVRFDGNMIAYKKGNEYLELQKRKYDHQDPTKFLF